MSGAIKYIRLTNLDDTNYVRLSFVSGTNSSTGYEANTADFKLEAKRTMIFTNTSFSGSATDASFDSFSSFSNLKGTANSDSVDIELFVATT